MGQLRMPWHKSSKDSREGGWPPLCTWSSPIMNTTGDISSKKSSPRRIASYIWHISQGFQQVVSGCSTCLSGETSTGLCTRPHRPHSRHRRHASLLSSSQPLSVSPKLPLMPYASLSGSHPRCQGDPSQEQ